MTRWWPKFRSSNRWHHLGCPKASKRSSFHGAKTIQSLPTLVENWIQIPKILRKTCRKSNVPQWMNLCFYRFCSNKNLPTDSRQKWFIFIFPSISSASSFSCKVQSSNFASGLMIGPQIAVAPIAFSRILDVHGWRFQVQGAGGNLDCPVLPCPEMRREKLPERAPNQPLESRGLEPWFCLGFHTSNESPKTKMPSLLSMKPQN